MFTGLVQQIGRVTDVRRGAGGWALHIDCTFSELVLGESIAVNGCCLTVTRIDEGGFWADASKETLERTTTASLRTGARVHLERALALGERLGGHIVSGHVDGVGHLTEKRPLGDALQITVTVPERLSAFVAPKGSVTLDGTSLTVNRVDGCALEVVLVPFTQKDTLLAGLSPGSALNVEVDVLAKYVARLMGRPGVDGSGAGEGLTLEALLRAGFASGS